MLVQGQAPEPGADLETDDARQAVAIAVRAARDGHAELLAAATAKWGDAHTAQLRAWAAERAADRWLQFDEDFITGVSTAQALSILAALTAYSGSRASHLVAFDKAFRIEMNSRGVFRGDPRPMTSPCHASTVTGLRSRSSRSPSRLLRSPLEELQEQFEAVRDGNQDRLGRLGQLGAEMDPMSFLHARMDCLIDSISRFAGPNGPRWALITRLEFEQHISPGAG